MHLGAFAVADSPSVLARVGEISAIAIGDTFGLDLGAAVNPPYVMPKFIIERELAGAGSLTAEQMLGVSKKSCGVLHELGTAIQWVESFVTDDKIYCVYIAPSEELIREHARLGGFPANRISAVRRMIDPTTAEG